MKPVILPAPNELFFSDLYKIEAVRNGYPNLEGVEFNDGYILIKLRHYHSFRKFVIIRVNQADYEKYFTLDEQMFDKTDIPIYTL